MKVNIYDMGSFRLIVIETRKYRRTVNISKNKPFHKLFDRKIYFENRKIFMKHGIAWIETKKWQELVDMGKLGAWINSPKQKRARAIQYKLRGYY